MFCCTGETDARLSPYGEVVRGRSPVLEHIRLMPTPYERRWPNHIEQNDLTVSLYKDIIQRRVGDLLARRCRIFLKSITRPSWYPYQMENYGTGYCSTNQAKIERARYLNRTMDVSYSSDTSSLSSLNFENCV